MHFLLALAFFIPGNLTATPDTNTFKCLTITKDDFYSDMKLKPEIMIIDVRSKDEFRAERIEGAVNIPVDKLPCRKAKKISRETVIYLYCKSGVRSCSAESKFNNMGFKHVFSLENGLNFWEKSGLPVICGRKAIRRTEFIPLSPAPALAKPSSNPVRK
jgi:rhodanese-related sulfurtransferase